MGDRHARQPPRRECSRSWTEAAHPSIERDQSDSDRSSKQNSVANKYLLVCTLMTASLQNFISEAFLFSVAMALILGEGFRSNRKEGKRRDMVADRLDSLEEAV